MICFISYTTRGSGRPSGMWVGWDGYMSYSSTPEWSNGFILCKKSSCNELYAKRSKCFNDCQDVLNIFSVNGYMATTLNLTVGMQNVMYLPGWRLPWYGIVHLFDGLKGRVVLCVRRLAVYWRPRFHGMRQYPSGKPWRYSRVECFIELGKKVPC